MKVRSGWVMLRLGCYPLNDSISETEAIATLTIMLTETGNEQTADIIGSGGGEGILNFSLGANASFASMAFDILQQCGFKEVD